MLLYSRDSGLAVGDSEATVEKSTYHHHVLSVNLWAKQRRTRLGCCRGRVSPA